MIPFGLLSGFMDSKEIRITELGEDGFRFRLAEECPEPEQFLICFYDMKKAGYRRVEIRRFGMSAAEEQCLQNQQPVEKKIGKYFYREYSVRVEQKDYVQEVRRLAGEYNRYIRLKLDGDDGELAKSLTGYPSELDEMHCRSLEEQKKRWFFRENEKASGNPQEAAIRAGARYFFGYPITPQTEIPEYMSARMPEVGGCFLQAESEVAAINMIYGAAGAGARALTSSSSPGVSLKQEGISYCAGAQLPAVILNVMRGGPGLGNIQASQGDYFQAVKGGGNGDYHLLTYAPASVQEAIDIMMYAFDKAEKYRIPVLFLADGIIAQMMEPVEMPEMVDYKQPCISPF